MKPGWRYSLTVRKGRYFFAQRLAGQDQDVIYMRTGLNGRDRALVDPHAWSRDHSASAELLDVSPDGTLIAYGVREGGEDETTVKLLDVDTRKEMPDRLPRARYRSVSLKAHRTGLFYARIGEEGPRLYYHAIGADPVGDQEIFGQGLGREKVLSAGISDDGRYLVILLEHGRGGSARTEIFCQDLQKEGPIFPVIKDIDAKFYGAVGGDVLFLRTNWHAPRGRILAVDLNNPAPEHWREVVPQEQAAIQDFYLAGGKLIVGYLENAASRVSVFEPDGRHVRDFNLPAMGSAYDISGQWSNDEAFFYFVSHHIPTTIYRYRMATGIRQLWWRPNVPLQASKLEAKQVWYRSKDGTRVPMFLLHRKGIRLDRSRPTLLSGYGHFGLSETPFFSAVAVLWTERGGVYAVPNLRGGGEFGEDWHKAGMLEKKQNVFDDFIAAAEWLIENGYTKPSKLAIIGGSGGGLTVGAALTQRPDLFQAAICGAPLLDMVRYHKFLVGQWWVPEFGSSEDPAQFKFLYAYSPYHRVKPGTKYPAVLLETGDSDTRVAPLHARKMTALLQAATASDRPILLRYDAKTGHSGGMSFSKLVEERAYQLAFVLWQLGETGPPDERK
jgi:prolyl oligopeptidase